MEMASPLKIEGKELETPGLRGRNSERRQYFVCRLETGANTKINEG